ncbi:LytTR family DNA-binding domain-containing protein [Paenibacillus solisilvae]|uniref:LytTR family DNA-binding domain-containing protein n=1 Tax=Paenibacillus solisilvae TaxID=2486751 RepID=A0ABW0WB48_9BACL
MRKLSVSRDIDGKHGFILVDISEIIYIEYDGIVNRVYVHTINDVFYTMGTLKYFVEGLNASGFDFKLVDRNSAVHMDKIVRLDQKLKMAFFELEITKKSKCCTIANRNFPEVVRSLTNSIILA